MCIEGRESQPNYNGIFAARKDAGNRKSMRFEYFVAILTPERLLQMRIAERRFGWEDLRPGYHGARGIWILLSRSSRKYQIAASYASKKRISGLRLKQGRSKYSQYDHQGTTEYLSAEGPNYRRRTSYEVPRSERCMTTTTQEADVGGDGTW